MATKLYLLHQQMASRSSRTVYVGNLPLDVKEWEIEDLFYKVCSSSLFFVLYFTNAKRRNENTIY